MNALFLRSVALRRACRGGSRGARGAASGRQGVGGGGRVSGGKWIGKGKGVGVAGKAGEAQGGARGRRQGWLFGIEHERRWRGLRMVPPCSLVTGVAPGGRNGALGYGCHWEAVVRGQLVAVHVAVTCC